MSRDAAHADAAERSKTVYEYAREVRRAIERAEQEPGSYWAALHKNPYPTFPLSTPLGAMTVRLLGRDQAVVEGEATIYGVLYRVFAHLEYADGTWRRYHGVSGFERVDRKWGHDITPARRRFDAVALPVIAAFLELEELRIARAGAQVVRLRWEIEVHHQPSLRDLDALAVELATARARVADAFASTQTTIARLVRELEDAAPAA